jgi:glycine cleavage system H protein
MVVLLVLLTVAIVIALQMYAEAQRRTQSASRIPEVRLSGEHLVSERFLHPGHSWVEVKEPKLVTVGVDDFAQRFIGRLTSLMLPKEGATVRQGDKLAALGHGNRVVWTAAPVSGTIVSVNHDAETRPSLVNESHYDKGWIVRIAPTKLRLELRNLLRGITAGRWRDALRMHLIQSFAPRVGTVLQDGGTYVENISDALTDEQWQKVASEFFTLCSLIDEQSPRSLHTQNNEEEGVSS